MVNESTEYQHALDYLYSFVDYSLTRQLRYSPEKFNLERMFRLMELMGNPQQKYPVIHVAGTKGKGSISAMTASILKQAGYKVGLYTSPHLSDYCERIQINNIPIPQVELIEQINRIKPKLEQVKEITTFEITTAIAFQFFFEQKVDIAVVEVGLGGRLDATNVITPLVSVISSLSFDHMSILGDTIAAIAGEKGGIIKSGCPVILAPQVYPDAEKRIREIALDRNAPLIEVQKESTYYELDHSFSGQHFSVAWRDQYLLNSIEKEEHSFFIPLLGTHQIENAVTALAIVNLLVKKGFSISELNIQDGLKNVSWPARFEIIKKEPLVIIDSAHNSDSARRLRNTIDEYLSDYKIILIFGASEDKDISGMFEYLLPAVNEVVFTKSIHPRAAEPELLVELAKLYNINMSIGDTIESALSLALLKSDPSTAILIAGSIFVAAAVRESMLTNESRID